MRRGIGVETKDLFAGRDATQVRQGTMRLLQALFPERFAQVSTTPRWDAPPPNSAGAGDPFPEE